MLYLPVIVQHLQPLQKLCERGSGIGNNRFHGIDRFQGIINANRVINFKMGFVNFRAKAGGSAHHLLKQDTGFHSTHKHQCCNFGNIYTCGQQVNGNNNTGKAFILGSSVE